MAKEKQPIIASTDLKQRQVTVNNRTLPFEPGISWSVFERLLLAGDLPIETLDRLAVAEGSEAKAPGKSAMNSIRSRFFNYMVPSVIEPVYIGEKRERKMVGFRIAADKMELINSPLEELVPVVDNREAVALIQLGDFMPNMANDLLANKETAKAVISLESEVLRNEPYGDFDYFDRIYLQFRGLKRLALILQQEPNVQAEYLQGQDTRVSQLLSWFIQHQDTTLQSFEYFAREYGRFQEFETQMLIIADLHRDLQTLFSERQQREKDTLFKDYQPDQPVKVPAKQKTIFVSHEKERTSDRYTQQHEDEREVQRILEEVRRTAPIKTLSEDKTPIKDKHRRVKTYTNRVAQVVAQAEAAELEREERERSMSRFYPLSLATVLDMGGPELQNEVTSNTVLDSSRKLTNAAMQIEGGSHRKHTIEAQARSLSEFARTLLEVHREGEKFRPETQVDTLALRIWQEKGNEILKIFADFYYDPEIAKQIPYINRTILPSQYAELLKLWNVSLGDERQDLRITSLEAISSTQAAAKAQAEERLRVFPIEEEYRKYLQTRELHDLPENLRHLITSIVRDVAKGIGIGERANIGTLRSGIPFTREWDSDFYARAVRRRLIATELQLTGNWISNLRLNRSQVTLLRADELLPDLLSQDRTFLQDMRKIVTTAVEDFQINEGKGTRRRDRRK